MGLFVYFDKVLNILPPELVKLAVICIGSFFMSLRGIMTIPGQSVSNFPFAQLFRRWPRMLCLRNMNQSCHQRLVEQQGGE